LGAWNASHQGWVYNPISSLWSISVEEQFYLFAPWTVKYFNRKSLYGFCAMLILSANIWLYYLGSVRAPDYRIWYDFFVQFECFAAGILLCLILHGRVPRISIWKRLALIASCFSCWMFASYGLHSRFFSASENPGSWPLIGGYALAALGSVMLLAAFLGIDPRLFPRWAIYMGRISFGLYVYHRFAIYTRDNLSIDSLLSIKAIPNY
jgi:peptidoglycan/LPS O-acetylase OafA/YrhL